MCHTARTVLISANGDAKNSNRHTLLKTLSVYRNAAANMQPSTSIIIHAATTGPTVRINVNRKRESLVASGLAALIPDTRRGTAGPFGPAVLCEGRVCEPA